MTHLTLVPQGGLCNRLRAVLSAVSLVEEQHVVADLRVGWSADAECAARFDQLFEPLGSPHVTIAPRHWHDRPVTRRNLHWPAIVRSLFYSTQYRNAPPPLPDLQRLLPPEEAFAAQQTSAAQEAPVPAASAAVRVRLYVSTGLAFCDYSPAYVRRLRPLPHLQQRIDALSAAFDAHTVGIHIRRTDHTTCIAESPDTLFLDAMQQVIDADPDTRFYLATDDATLKASLMERFPGRITTQECRGTRSDLRGMEEAVIDLWTLARTSRLLGSYWSSYTDTAAEIGGMPLDIIRKTR